MAVAFIHNDRPVSPIWHQGGNQLITFFSMLASGYKFTDVETCYKMFPRELIKDISTRPYARNGLGSKLN